jgi:hypothetical protein
LGGGSDGEKEGVRFLNRKATDGLPIRFRAVLMETLRDEDHAAPLREAASAGRLMAWTKALTSASVDTCSRLGWKASAKGHESELLPVRRGEYLGLDVIAFAPGERRWRFPLAVMELENQAREDAIAYSLWKVLSVRATLRVLFCYRKEASQAGSLKSHLQDEVIGSMDLGTRAALEGDTLLVIGRRAQAETFPHGFFAWWRLDANTGRFENF